MGKPQALGNGLGAAVLASAQDGEAIELKAVKSVGDDGMAGERDNAFLLKGRREPVADAAVVITPVNAIKANNPDEATVIKDGSGKALFGVKAIARQPYKIASIINGLSCRKPREPLHEVVAIGINLSE